MKVKILSAKNSQIPEILGMMTEFNTIDNYHFDKKIGNNNLIDFISNSELGKLWVIYLEDKIVGYIILTFGFSFEYEGRDAFIDEFFIKEGFRNQGIGRQTMELIDVQAKELGINAIHLEVERQNQKGNRLYLSQGYKSNDRMLLTKRIGRL